MIAAEDSGRYRDALGTALRRIIGALPGTRSAVFESLGGQPWLAFESDEAALARFPHRDDVEVRWHSFELDPRAPRVREGDRLGHLSAKYGISREQAQAMERTITEAAASLGLELRLDRARGGNTFDAHRLLHLAEGLGLGAAVKERFLQAYFTDGEPIGDTDVLRRVAVDAGLRPVEVDEVLAGDRYADAVRADEAQAHAYGATGVPFSVAGSCFQVFAASCAAVSRAV